MGSAQRRVQQFVIQLAVRQHGKNALHAVARGKGTMEGQVQHCMGGIWALAERRGSRGGSFLGLQVATAGTVEGRCGMQVLRRHRSQRPQNRSEGKEWRGCKFFGGSNGERAKGKLDPVVCRVPLRLLGSLAATTVSYRASVGPSAWRHIHEQAAGAVKVHGDVVGGRDELRGGAHRRELAALQVGSRGLGGVAVAVGWARVWVGCGAGLW